MWLAVKISLVLFMLGFMIPGKYMDKSRKDLEAGNVELPRRCRTQGQGKHQPPCRRQREEGGTLKGH